jgi:tetratricopeptide (TPR) repeat protein
MRWIFTVCIFCCVLFNAHAQNNSGIDTALKFNQRYTKCERKWVVISKADTAKDYLFGFIYIDEVAGFTFDMKGSFRVDNNDRYIVDTTLSKNSSVKYRISPNWRNVALLPRQRLSELHIPAQPSWVKLYYADNRDTSVLYNYRMGFLYNDANECQTALTYLKKAYQLKPHFHGLEFEMAFAYNALNQTDSAINILELAVKYDNANVLFYRELGYAYLHKEIYDKSISYYKQGIEICTNKQMDTKCEMAINMAKAYQSSGDHADFTIWGNKAKSWATPGTPLYKFIVSQGF